MNKVYNLTQDQLNFVIKMRDWTASNPWRRKRFEALMLTLPVRENNDKTTKPEKIKSGEIQKHSPQAMINFLSLFSRDDRFKWYTHRWDQGGVTLENLINGQKAARKQLYNLLTATSTPINHRTYTQVWNFINFKPEPGKNYPWIDNNGNTYRIGWHSVIEAAQEKPQISVENLIVGDGHQFKDYIRLFKSSIEFRLDLGPEARFNRFVRNVINQSINGALEVTYGENVRKIGKDINIYCDVPAVREALNIICDWMVKYKVNGTKVNVDLAAGEGFYELKIFQEGSYFANLKKLENPSGDLAKLRKRLFSVCDFTMVGDCVEDGRKVNGVAAFVLEDSTTVRDGVYQPCRLERTEKEIGGIEYKLKFYKG